MLKRQLGPDSRESRHAGYGVRSVNSEPEGSLEERNSILISDKNNCMQKRHDFSIVL
jgi:hypothetical protein